jgi:hypothetical protein
MSWEYSFCGLAAMPKGRRHDPNRAPSARAQKDADEDTPGGAAVLGLGDFCFRNLACHGDRGVQGRVLAGPIHGERLRCGRASHTL